MTKTFKHSGDLSDIIYSLPVVRHLGGGKLLLNLNSLPNQKHDGTEHGLNAESIKWLTPLLELQKYVFSVDVLEDQAVIVDLDQFREKQFLRENLCENILESFAVPFSEIDRPWISCDRKQVAPIVVSRSMRFRNENLNYNHVLQNLDECVFVGLSDEHADFEKLFGKIAYHPVNHALEFAEIINGCELFVGNQSFGMSLAVAMCKTLLQEYSPVCHDCIFDRKNTHYIYVKNHANIS